MAEFIQPKGRMHWGPLMGRRGQGRSAAGAARASLDVSRDDTGKVWIDIVQGLCSMGVAIDEEAALQLVLALRTQFPNLP